MEDIDIKTITLRAVKEICDMPLEHSISFINGFFTRIKMTPEQVRKLLFEKVWGMCIEQLNGLYAATEPLVIEKALSELMKKGVLKDRIVFKKESFRLRLENGRYRAYKHGVTGGITASPWPADHEYSIMISGKRFAEFILQFDAEIPEILTHLPEVLEAVRRKELEEKQQDIERN